MVRVGSVILAAGLSERFVSNKLLLLIDGKPLISMAVAPFLMERIEERIVVIGRDREKLEGLLRGLPIRIIFNPKPQEGLSSSIRIALSHLNGKDCAFIHLADKPFVQESLLERMIQVFEVRRPFACVPECRGLWGHPVLVDVERVRSEMDDLRGDEGLRRVLLRHKAEVSSIPADEGCLFDVDTEEDVRILRERGFSIEEG